MASIGEQIREARKTKGLTQDALAEALNVSRSTVANWESERRIPDGKMLLQLSKALDYSFEAERMMEHLEEPQQEPDTGDEQVEMEASGTSQEASDHPAPSTSAPSRLPRKRVLVAVSALAAAALLFALWFFLILPNLPKTVYTDTDGSRYTIAQFQTAVENEEGKAYLRLEPTVTLTEGENYNYWMYGFNMYEENGIALSVNRVEEFVFGEKKLVHRTYGAADIEAYGTSLEIEPHGEWWFGGGFPVQKIRGVGIRVSCTDAQGASLTFVSYLPLAEK